MTLERIWNLAFFRQAGCFVSFGANGCSTILFWTFVLKQPLDDCKGRGEVLDLRKLTNLKPLLIKEKTGNVPFKACGEDPLASQQLSSINNGFFLAQSGPVFD